MRVDVFKTTTDDWYGSYVLQEFHKGVDGKMLVGVSFLGNIVAYDKTKPPVWRTCVWGNDDYGMNFDCASEGECWIIFLRVIGMENVNQKDLKQLGFKYD